MSTNDIHDAIIALVMTAQYEVTGEEGTAKVDYFKTAWKRMPDKIPMGTRHGVIVQKAQSPTFEYTTCAEHTTEKMEFWITIVTKGAVNSAQTENNDVTDAVKKILLLNSKLNGTCIDSGISMILNGEISDVENKKLVAVSRIFLNVASEVF